MFKLISEAYAVLSDEEKRKVYDKFGVDAVRDSEQAMDPSIMFKVIFGGGCFDEIFGELLFAKMMTLTMELEGNETEEAYEKVGKIIEEFQIQRVEKLVEHLSTLLDNYIAGKDKDWKSLQEGVTEKLEAPGGPALLESVSYIYIQEAKKQMGVFSGVIANIQETTHNVKQNFALVKAAVKLQIAQDKLEEQGATDEGLDEVASHSINTIWRMGKIEIEKTIREVCQAVLKDKTTRKKRANALKDLGEFYKKECKKVGKRFDGPVL
eukprot:TRINITY_DN898_c0_g1_i1.p1 TRINITY_DN898_c0_g1~~TRINITY_DN898_c0_g1_i1.p1  ORF type:complete len:266 (-),score=79.88 TRINITY_DN898_c0_g1_i1:251-1048(-)